MLIDMFIYENTVLDLVTLGTMRVAETSGPDCHWAPANDRSLAVHTGGSALCPGMPRR